MLKRKMLAILLPTVAASALVGSGFSAWYFETNTITPPDKIEVGVTVTDKVGSVGTLVTTGDNPKLLVLDQAGYANKTNSTKGIYFATGSSDNYTTLTYDGEGSSQTVGFSFTFTDGEYDKLTDAGMKVKITQVVTISSNLGGYVDVNETKKADLGDKTGTNGTNDLVYKTTFDVDTAEGLSKDINIGTKDDINDLLTYVNKPATDELYEAMKTSLASGQSISFSWSAEIVSIA